MNVVFLSLLTASFGLSVCFGFVLSLYAAIFGGLCWSEDRMQVFHIVTLAFCLTADAPPISMYSQ